MTNDIIGYAVIATVPGRFIPMFVISTEFMYEKNTKEDALALAREILGPRADITVAPVINTDPKPFGKAPFRG